FSDDEQRSHFRITAGNPFIEGFIYFEKELKRELCSAMMSNDPTSGSPEVIHPLKLFIFLRRN
ncbi:hypothetical protein, partial [Zhouia amylolytica]|uniref:hypothetical protein n=1 Tax=Zhouia amylolytica TaxID=376730 RepID=UPI000571019C